VGVASAAPKEVAMFSHVTIGTSDLARAITFYDAALAPLGIERIPTKYKTWAAWQQPGEAAKLWVGHPYDGQAASRGNGWMAAFAAPSRAAVDAAYAAAMAAGGSDEGKPGPRPHFAPDYYGAYVRDPDGNKLHFVHRG
jgi:catechol 2,3-dioxygenase-like lactoylglutathione lyase family enzyme